MATTDLIEHFLQATEAAAVAASAWRGLEDGKAADGAAVEAMRTIFDSVPFDGRVAIGEGERDDAPMLWIGEPLGSMQGIAGAPAIDIAVDPLECTNHVALDLPNAMAVLAAAPRGNLLHAPDCYMDKIAGPAALEGEVSLEAVTAPCGSDGQAATRTTDTRAEAARCQHHPHWRWRHCRGSERRRSRFRH